MGIDPRSFFERLVHPRGNQARPGWDAHHEGEVILEQGADVSRMLIVRAGEVTAWKGGVLVCTYVADPPRHGTLPILSASDYCFGRASDLRYVAATDVETITLDTPLIHKMARRENSLQLIRNLALFSDLGPMLREKIAQEYALTGAEAFKPADEPGADLLRNTHKKGDPQRAACEQLLLDFAARLMTELTAGRIFRSRTPSTTITPLTLKQVCAAADDIPSNQGVSE